MHSVFFFFAVFKIVIKARRGDWTISFLNNQVKFKKKESL